MFQFDRILVAPGRADLERTLTEATAAANKGCRARLLHWTPAATDALLLDNAAAPAGFRQWTGTGEGKRRGSGNDKQSAVAVVWWTDRLQRVHYRIASDRVECAFSHSQNLLCPYEERPPLWLIYPENLYFREEEANIWKPFAICRCGVTGAPDALGWMGPCCAVCHDRAEAGEGPLIPLGEPARTLLAAGRSRWVAFTADRRYLVSLGARQFYQQEVLIWDLGTGEMEHSNCSNAAGSLAVSVDGTIVIEDPSGHLRLRSLARPNEPERSLSVGSDRILALAFSPNGRLVAIAPYGRAELWDVVTGTRTAVLATGLTAHSSSRLLAFSPDGGKVAVAAGGRDVLVWDVAAERSKAIRVPDASFLDAVAFSPDGRTLAVNDESPGAACLLDVTERRYTPVPGAGKARDLAFSPDGRLLAVANPFGSLNLHDATDGRPRASLLWHTESATSVAFSPDGRWVATASDDGFIKLWPVEALLSSSGPSLRAQ
jgi:hypothetical protein